MKKLMPIFQGVLQPPTFRGYVLRTEFSGLALKYGAKIARVKLGQKKNA
jgi:hypothetical protein